MRNTVPDVCERELRRFTALISEIQHDRDKMFNFPDYIIFPDCFCSISPLPKLFHLRFAFIIEILKDTKSTYLVLEISPKFEFSVTMYIQQV